MRSDEPAEHRATLLHGRQLVRPGLIEVGEIARQGGGEVRGAVAEVGDLRGELVEGRIVPALERATRFGQQHAHVRRVTVSGERVMRRRRRSAQLFRVREPFCPECELGVLARLRIGLLRSPPGRREAPQPRAHGRRGRR